MAKSPTHKWTFHGRFRRHAFGWKSQPAIGRINEAVVEIKTVANVEPLLGAEGAVLFIEKLSPAIEQVDSSSGAIGSAVNSAIAELAEIVGAAAVDADVRDEWLERIWKAYEDDDIPYLESIGDQWGALCGSPDVASRWADELIDDCKLAWEPDSKTRRYFMGTTNCLSALLAAGRHDELIELLDLEPYKMWHYRQFGMKALLAMGRRDEAIRYAEVGLEWNENPVTIAHACEEVLLESDLVDEAYERYGLVANQRGTYLAWFRAVVKKYPHKGKSEVLVDLVAHTPGNEGKWFAAAKSAKLFDEAIALANQSPCAPSTLTRASRAFEVKKPGFAVEAGVAALRWLVEGEGYKVTRADVLAAYSQAMSAAEHAGVAAETRARICELVSCKPSGENLATRALSRHLELG